MVGEYNKNDQPAYAKATLVTILLNLVIQLALVLFQSWRHGTRELIKEVFFMVKSAKPGVDVYRVAMGRNQELNAVFDPVTSMAISKSCELFAEAIRGSVIQTMAYVKSKHSNVAALSLSLFSVKPFNYSLRLHFGSHREGP